MLNQQKKSINLTWSQDSAPEVDAPQDLIFSLKINYGSKSRVVSLRESTYHFTAPEGAPPCQIYNFSVTATYVGATYTGASCSVPSPVIRTMLPSLPDTNQVESSLSYLLTKQPNGGLILHVSLSVSC
jgi:hypothetical protein